MNNESGIHPTFDKVLVKTVEVEEKSVGGIVLASSTKDKENQAQVHGTLIEMGPVAEVSQELKGVQLGDLVIHAKYAGLTYMGRDGKVYRLMRASDIIAKAEGVHDKNFRASIPMPSSAIAA